MGKKLIVLAVVLLMPLSVVYAVDNNTEFGIEDDLTVLGTGGTQADPDAEIKGFSLFGSSMGITMGIPAEPGNVLFGGEIQVSSGLYVTGGSTFTATVNLPAASSIFVSGGSSGQVLKKAANGWLEWASDNTGAGANIWYRDNAKLAVLMSTMTDIVGIGIASPLAKLHVSSANVAASDYLFIVSSGTANRFTIKGDGTTDIFGNLNINTSMFQVTAANGNTVIAGNLTANGNAQLGDASTDDHGINVAPEDGIALKIVGEDASNKYITKFYSGTNLAAWIKKK